jgi:hypothetical protein
MATADTQRVQTHGECRDNGELVIDLALDGSAD